MKASDAAEEQQQDTCVLSTCRRKKCSKKASLCKLMVLRNKHAHISHKYTFIYTFSCSSHCLQLHVHPFLVVSSSLDLLLDMPIHQAPVLLSYER